MSDNMTDRSIAIIGMSGRFPGAKNIDEYWAMLSEGKEGLNLFSSEELLAAGISNEILDHPNYIKIGGVMPDYDQFDAKFFGYGATEAIMLDPQYRVFLEESWKALENAGIDTTENGKRIGVFAGGKNNLHTYLETCLKSNEGSDFSAFELGVFAETSQLATRVSYDLDLTGPSMQIQAGCSTSLVAVHTACMSLLNGDCDAALAGGITILSPPKSGYLYQEGLVYSADGKCRAFDKDASGTIMASGVGIVVLKRLQDAVNDGDRIDAVIRGSAINNDGKHKIGFTAPSIDGQAEVIATALNVANISPETISYVEAHGTATPIGDPIEISALTRAYNFFTDKKNFCAIGSAKTNIGHLDVAAGVAGLIKVVLAMKNRIIPANLHYNAPNPKLELEKTPFYVNHTKQQWSKSGNIPRRAGISAFGVGGTNVHMVLEEASLVEDAPENDRSRWLCLSAKNAHSLNANIEGLQKYLASDQNINLADLEYTLQTGHQSLEHKCCIFCRNREEAINTIAKKELIYSSSKTHKNHPKDLFFMFSGERSQYHAMGYELYVDSKIYHDCVDECASLLKRYINTDIRNYLYHSETPSESADEVLSLLSLCVTEYAMARLWKSLGLMPTKVLGYGVGEYMAACFAGVLSLSDALLLVYKKALLLESLEKGQGLKIFLPENEVSKLLKPGLAIVEYCAKNVCVVAGKQNDIDMLINLLEAKDIPALLSEKQYPLVAEITNQAMNDYCEAIESITLNKPKLPISFDATEKSFWVKHAKKPIRFGCQFNDLLDKDVIFLEIGPGSALLSLAKKDFLNKSKHLFLMSLPDWQQSQNTRDIFARTLSQLWLEGVQINFQALYLGEKRHRLSLSGYVFDHQKFWPSHIVNVDSNQPMVQQQAIATDRPTSAIEVKQSLVAIWQRIFGIEELPADAHFFGMGGNSLSALRMVNRIIDTFRVKFPVTWIYANDNIEKQTKRVVFELKKSFKPKLAKSITQNNALITFKESEVGIPLFLVHPSRAGAEVYYRLIQKIDKDIPVYGLESHNLYCHSDDYIRSIESLASKYIQTLKNTHPKGPYCLGGWSMGGIIAYEMAQQLIAKGDKVLNLYLLDSSVTTLCDEKVYTEVIPVMQKLVLGLGKVSESYKQRLQKLAQVECDMLATYKNYNAYDQKVVLFKAKQVLQQGEEDNLSPEEAALFNQMFHLMSKETNNGWAPYLSSLETILLDCTHKTILSNGCLEIISNYLTQELP